MSHALQAILAIFLTILSILLLRTYFVEKPPSTQKTEQPISQQCLDIKNSSKQYTNIMNQLFKLKEKNADIIEVGISGLNDEIKQATHNTLNRTFTKLQKYISRNDEFYNSCIKSGLTINDTKNIYYISIYVMKDIDIFIGTYNSIIILARMELLKILPTQKYI